MNDYPNIRKHITVMYTKFSALLFAILLAVTPITVFAASDDPQTSAGFTYTLQFPDNQIDTELNYYKLMMVPGQEQEIVIVLSNPGTNPCTVDLNLNGAKTNGNGGIEWTNPGLENDSSLMFPFEEIVSGPESVVLEGGETKEVPFSIKMPETGYEGIIAGGLQLIKKETDEAEEANDGSKVINRYAYAISIILQEGESELTPDLHYNKTYAGQSNYRNSIFVNLSNVVPNFLNDLTIEAQISRQDGNMVLYEAKTTSMRMAPNSMIDFPISMNGDKMEAGVYTSHILAISGEQRWEWTEEFEISEDEATEFNERDVGLTQETSIDLKLVIGIVVGFMAVVLILFIILRVTRQRKGKKERISKKKKKIK